MERDEPQGYSASVCWVSSNIIVSMKFLIDSNTSSEWKRKKSSRKSSKFSCPVSRVSRDLWIYLHMHIRKLFLMTKQLIRAEQSTSDDSALGGLFVTVTDICMATIASNPWIGYHSKTRGRQKTLFCCRYKILNMLWATQIKRKFPSNSSPNSEHQSHILIYTLELKNERDPWIRELVRCGEHSKWKPRSN